MPEKSRKKRKTWRNYNEKQFGRRKKMKNGRVFWKGRERKKKTLLLHYDKHENNFPPIFSIKIIAFLISFCLIFAEEVLLLTLLLFLFRCWRAWNWNHFCPRSPRKGASNGWDGNENIYEKKTLEISAF